MRRVIVFQTEGDNERTTPPQGTHKSSVGDFWGNTNYQFQTRSEHKPRYSPLPRKGRRERFHERTILEFSVFHAGIQIHSIGLP